MMRIRNNWIHAALWITLTALVGCSPEAEVGGKIPPLPSKQANRHQVAIDALSDAIAATPRSADMHFKRALLYQANQQHNLALGDINRAIELRGNIGKFYLLKAQLAAQLKRVGEAIESAEKAEVLDVETPDLFVLLGDLNQQYKRFTKAESYLNKAIQMTPRNAEAFYVKGLIAAQRYDTTAALSLLQRSIELRPSWTPSYIKLVAIHNQLRAYPIAHYYAKTGLTFTPKEAELWYLRGQTYQRTWKIDSALICYKSAIRWQPNHANSNLQAGLIYFKQNDLIKALRMFEIVLKTQPNTPMINYLLGQCMEYLGRTEEAQSFYDFALKQNAADTKAQAGYWRTTNRLTQRTYVSSPLPTTNNPAYNTAIPVKKSLDSTLKINKLPAIGPKTKPETKSDSLLRRRLTLPPRQ